MSEQVPYAKQLQDKLDAENKVLQTLAPHFELHMDILRGTDYDPAESKIVGVDKDLNPPKLITEPKLGTQVVRDYRVVTIKERVRPQFFEKKTITIAIDLNCSRKTALEHLAELAKVGIVIALPTKEWKANPVPNRYPILAP